VDGGSARVTDDVTADEDPCDIADREDAEAGGRTDVPEHPESMSAERAPAAMTISTVGRGFMRFLHSLASVLFGRFLRRKANWKKGRFGPGPALKIAVIGTSTDE
jgi:hypothetical protein